MSDEETLKMWREMPSDHKQFDELVLEFARKLKASTQLEQVLEECALLCDNYSADKWRRYKSGFGPERGNAYYEGQADGAGECAEAIRAMKVDLPAQPQVPDFIVRRAEAAIDAATNHKGMHTNGPAYARIEASTLHALLRYAKGG